MKENETPKLPNINKNLLSLKQLAPEKVKRQEQLKLLGEEMKKAFNIVFSSKEGIVVGQWLMSQCKFINYSVPVNKHSDIATEFVVYNKGRRDLYLQLRSFLDRDVINNLETIKVK